MKCYSQSERVLNYFTDVINIARNVLDVDIGLYPSAVRIANTGEPVPAGFYAMKLISVRYYGGVATDWPAELAGFERAIASNHLRRFEATILWRYDMALVRTVASGTHQNRRVQVWTGAVVNLLRLNHNVFANDDRANTFWNPLFKQFILNIEKASHARIDRHVSETPLHPLPLGGSA